MKTMKTMKTRPIINLFLMVLAGVILSACEAQETILPGERIAISSGEINYALSIDGGARAEGVGLPAALANDRFVAPGNNAGHAGGHFTVDLPIGPAFKEKVGISADGGTDMAQPVANSRAVFTVTPGGVVRASSADDGDMIWRVDIDPSEDKTQTSTSGGMALGVRNGQDILYVHAAKNTLYALNAENGQVVWSVEFDVFLSGGPTVDRDVVVISDSGGRLYALSAIDGEEIWNRIGTREDTSIAGASFPAVSGNYVITAGGDGEFLAISRNSGTLRWGENLTPIELRTALDGIADIRAHPVHDGRLVFIVTHGGVMYAFQAETGRIVWEQNIQGIEMPWLSGQSIYVTTIDGRVVCLRRIDGAVRWVTELPGAYDPSLPVVKDLVRYTSAIVVSGKVVVASDQGDLFILNAETGVIEDELSTSGSVTTPPIVASGTIYVLNKSGELIAYR
jgi:outer membrane protein assembly factor BamB